jgi:hypothetical protein
MSFKSTLGGTTGTTNVGMNALNQSNTGLFQNAGLLQPQGSNLLNLGVPNSTAGAQDIGAGANYFKNLLGGNQAETGTLLAPDINRIQGAQQQALQAASTLMPRGSGRSGSLFQLPFSGTQQVQSLYNSGRSGAAAALPQVGSALGSLGLGQGGLGGNLFGIADAALGTAGQQGAQLAHIGQTQQAMQNAITGSIIKSLLGAVSGGLFGGGGGGGSAPFGTYSVTD